MVGTLGFERAFEPCSIAVVGVSRSEQQEHVGSTGLGIMRALRHAGYQGHVYPINPNAGEIDGVRAYPSVTSVPELLDLVIVTVPAVVVPQVLEDCVAARAMNVHVCSSGFAETGEEKGRVLEEKVRQIALRGGLRLVGPNCMGIQVPRARVSTFDGVPLVDGPVAFLSQSGGHTHRLLQYGPTVGIGFSIVISYGNAAGMDVTDFLEYLGSDHGTKVICLYLEGARNGNLLTRMVRRINLVKPVVVWKGGLSDSGARAVASHTGSLGGNKQMWDAFFKQTGAVRAGSIEELAEVSAALVSLPPSLGKRVVVISGGGGNNVAAGDMCAEEGIRLPPLSAETRRGLGEFLSTVNQGLTNPLEAPSLFEDPGQMNRALRLLDTDAGVDMVIVSLMMAHIARKGPNLAGQLLDCLAKIALDKSFHKTLVVTLSDPVTAEAARYWQQIGQTGIPWYPTLRQTCRAVSRYASYYEFVERARGCIPAGSYRLALDAPPSRGFRQRPFFVDV